MAYQSIFRRLIVSHNHRMRGNSSRQDGKILHFHHDSRESITSTLKKLKDTVLLIEATKGPGAKAAFGVAQGAATAAFVFGTGCGVAAFSNTSKQKTDTVVEDKQPVTEEVSKAVSKRIGLTYFHMANSILVSGLTALLSFRLFRNRALVIRMGERPLVAIGLGVVTPLTMATVVRYLPHTEQKEGVLIPFGLKEFGNLLYSGSIGLLAAPLYLLGGQSIHRAIFITAGLWTGLQGVAHLTPQNSLSSWGKPIAYALNAVLLAFILTIILGRSHRAFNPLFRLTMHGGILVYSAHYCYVAQAIKEAAKSPTYDPVNAAMALSMDLLSLYGRFAFLLPPHFQLSREHHFIVKGQPMNSRANKNHDRNETETTNFNKPGNDDMN